MKELYCDGLAVCAMLSRNPIDKKAIVIDVY
jgi:hypothetical protein